MCRGEQGRETEWGAEVMDDDGVRGNREGKRDTLRGDREGRGQAMRGDCEEKWRGRVGGGGGGIGTGVRGSNKR